jgi:hypothetical protein
MMTTVWVALWAERVLQSGAIQYIELNASHRALAPYGYIVPLAVPANYEIPLGLMLAQSERVESYEPFFSRLFETDSPLMEVVDRVSVLTDPAITVGSSA